MDKIITEYPVTQMLSNKQYYTYQLSCCINMNTTSCNPLFSFNKVLLYVMDWLRQRIDVNSKKLAELSFLSQYPEIEQFASFNIESCSNIKLKGIYDINSIFLKDEYNWCLRFEEHDNLSQFKSTDTIFHGRIFTTDIAIKLDKSCTFLSVRTTCTEPSLNSEDCKVYRPKFVHLLCRDTQLRVYELSDINTTSLDFLSEVSYEISTNSDCNNLAKDIIFNSNRQLPVLLFTSKNEALYDINFISNKLVSFCHVYLIMPSQFNRLFKARLSDDNIDVGDIIVIGDNTTKEVFKYDSITNDTQDYIINFITTFMVRKNISYHTPLFYKESKIKLFSLINNTDIDSLINNQHIFDQTLSEKDLTISQIQNDLNSVRAELRTAQKTLYEYEKIVDEEHSQGIKDQLSLAEFENVAKSLKSTNNTYKDLLSIIKTFPDSKNDLISWIENNFDDQIIIHSKGKSTFSKAKSQYKLRSLCNCIIYLNAYMLYKRHQISEKDLTLYDLDNNWNITSCGKQNYEKYPEYSITYNDRKGNSINDYLSFHIRSGGDPMTLFRVYFCISDEIDRLIIGAMPDHLPTISGF